VVIPLFKKNIYGPVYSRRLGNSLGINLLPANYKLCSFDCLYCHFGWTKESTIDVRGSLQDLPRVDEVLETVEEAAKSSLEFDFFTFSGNGEPTLHPQFATVVEEIVRIRNTYRPMAKIALLSNSTGLTNKEVRASIADIDFPMFKLDAGTEEKFKAINRPAKGVNFAEIVDALASMERIYIQTLLIEGTPNNVAAKDLEAYFHQISKIRPKEVHIYSIDRPVPATRIALVPPARLEEIALQGQKETGVPIKAWYPRKTDSIGVFTCE
jgi:wyosine [tRNA(Phe)-imidazoG37] synthetase (radical SAM superfamily)